MNTQLLQQRSRHKDQLLEIDASRTCDTNSNILNAVEIKLRDSGHYCLTMITCEIQHAYLTLQGTVTSFYLKQVAQEAVRQVPGVIYVLNLIEVITVTNHMENI
jgi:osmotically-inducible protein OsmY